MGMSGEKAGQNDVQKLRVRVPKTCARHHAGVTDFSGVMLLCKGTFGWISIMSIKEGEQG